MKRIWKFAPVAGLLLAGLVFFSGCLGTTGTGTADQGSSGSSIWPMIAFLVVIFALFYFVMIRPQRKRQKEHQTMMQGLQKGDNVITAGGIFGRIESLSDDSVVIKIESGATIRVARGSVAVRQQKEDYTIK
jgi:preprotein translocase subunit YajC